VAADASWRWLGTPTTWPEGWLDPTYDDTAWASGPAPLGFGSRIVTDTQASAGSAEQPVSTIYRRTFTIEDPAEFTDVVLTTHADDGIVIYLNGTEINRTNMPNGTLTATSYATASPSSHSALAAPVTMSVPVSLLRPGTNVITASVHLNYLDTADSSFVVSLTGVTPR
ncbi:MAG: hypothetical protein ACK5H2_04610, partial [Beutenbergiaceae bacterium]